MKTRELKVWKLKWKKNYKKCKLKKNLLIWQTLNAIYITSGIMTQQLNYNPFTNRTYFCLFKTEGKKQETLVQESPSNQTYRQAIVRGKAEGTQIICVWL